MAEKPLPKVVGNPIIQRSGGIAGSFERSSQMASRRIHLNDYLDSSTVTLKLSGSSKAEVLRELLAPLRLEPADAEAILKTLLHREMSGSTGVGRGMAFPHCRTPRVATLRVVYGRHDGGVDYGAIDGGRVKHFFLLIAPP